MGIRHYNPTSAGRRGGSVSDFSEITDRKKKPEKSLLEPKPRKGGRNNQGIICTRFRGGGHKRRYRFKVGTMANWKKAIVTLHEEDRIEFF